MLKLYLIFNEDCANDKKVNFPELRTSTKDGVTCECVVHTV